MLELHDLPFFDPAHAAVLAQVDRWLAAEPGLDDPDEDDYVADSARFVRSLGAAGLLRHAVSMPDDRRRPDVRAICLIREAICYRSALADSAFVMQGICAAPIWKFGTPEQRAVHLEPLAAGTAIPAFALSEPDGGSDVAATKTEARADGEHFVINGDKTWTSNAGIANTYLVIARTGERPGAKGLSAFLVPADTPGLVVGKAIVVSAPHPMASLHLRDCRVPRSAMLGQPGDGFKVAMSTLDVFRTTVGAAAVGLAARAFDETVARMRERRLFGKPMAEMEGVQMKIAEMYGDLEAARLVVYRSAWAIDKAQGTLKSEQASLAKLFASEAAQRVIDSAVQLYGGLGVTRGCIVERLYRDIRPMRIYEGASEIQKLIIGRQLLRPR